MILFVFEGGKAEPKIFESIKKLFLSGEELHVVRCGFDLPTLYANLKKNGEDLFRSLPLEENGILIPEGKRVDTMFSQIFLFFDYDFQNRMGIKRLNDILEEMLDFFSDETENGKLYVNYPMVESLKYTKELPDEKYYDYEVTRQECVEHRFKDNAEKYAYNKAKGYRFIDIERNDNKIVIANWKLLQWQNVSKANYMLTGEKKIPEDKQMINQKKIFDVEVENFVVPKETVSILNSFPLFLYDYRK